MPIGQMRQTLFKDANQSLFQQSINDQFSEIGKIPFINGILIENIELVAATPKSVNHRLGRVPVGYFVILSNAAAAIYNSGLSETAVILNSTANVTISIWVF